MYYNFKDEMYDGQEVEEKAKKYKIAGVIAAPFAGYGVGTMIATGAGVAIGAYNKDSLEDAIKETDVKIKNGVTSESREITTTYTVAGGNEVSAITYKPVDLKTLKAEQQQQLKTINKDFDAAAANFDFGTVMPYILIASTAALIARYGFYQNTANMFARAEIGAIDLGQKAINSVKDLFKKNKGDDKNAPKDDIFPTLKM